MSIKNLALFITGISWTIIARLAYSSNDNVILNTLVTKKQIWHRTPMLLFSLWLSKILSKERRFYIFMIFWLSIWNDTTTILPLTHGSMCPRHVRCLRVLTLHHESDTDTSCMTHAYVAPNAIDMSETLAQMYGELQMQCIYINSSLIVFNVMSQCNF